MKKTVGFIIIFSMLISLALPALAADSGTDAGGASADFSDKYLGFDTGTIFWDAGVQVTVREDGAFLSAGGEWIVPAAESKNAVISEVDGYYPVTTHSFSDSSFDYSVKLFIDCPDEAGTVLVLARVSVKNKTDSSLAFPAASASLTAISPLPGVVIPKGDASADYMYVYSAPEGVAVDSAAAAIVYDACFAHMSAHFYSMISGTAEISALPSHGDIITKYRRSMIKAEKSSDDVSCAAALGMNMAEGYGFSPSHGFFDIYPAALYLRQSGDAAFAASLYESLSASMAELEAGFVPVGGGSLYTAGAGEVPLETNLDILLSYDSLIYITKTLTAGEADGTVYTDALVSLGEKRAAFAASLEAAMQTTVASCTSAWECCDTEGSAEDGILTLRGEGFSSAAALADWYTKTVAFAGASSTPALTAFARDAMKYAESTESICIGADALLSALVCERYDGTVVIGQGMPSSFLAEGSDFTVSGVKLTGGRTISVRFTVTDGSLSLTLTPSAPVSFSVEIPAFYQNIEYSSCGFDAQTGIVSVPAGTSEVTVRAITPTETVREQNAAAALLEREIALSESSPTDSATAYSLGLFSAALKNAADARTSPTEEKQAAAAALAEARDSLSPMISGYEMTIPADGELIREGTAFTAAGCYQLFHPDYSGTLYTLSLRLSLSDGGEGYKASVYTLRDDGCTPDKLLGEAPGEPVTLTDGAAGVSFTLKTALAGENTYVMFIERDGGAMQLSVAEGEDGGSLYTLDGSHATYYTGVTLAARLNFVQADRSELDSFLAKCMETDTSSYTKESLNRFAAAMNDAKTALCSSMQTAEDYNEVYTALMDAYSSLSTYVSDKPVEDTPAALYILLAAAAVLIIGGGVAAVIASRKKKDY